MKIKKLHVVLFSCLFSLTIFAAKEITPVYLGDEWGPGFFPEIVKIQRLLPVISYMKKEVFLNIVKKIVRRRDIKIIFQDLEESPFKMEIRRQYYLFTKGDVLDSTLLGFSLTEFLNSGMLDQKIKNASRDGILNLSSLKIADLAGLFEVVNKVSRIISELNLSGNLLEKINKNDLGLNLSRIKNLDLSYNQIKFFQNNCLRNLKNLKFLGLNNNKIAEIPLNLFKPLSNLKNIDLSNNYIKSAKGIFKGLKKLDCVNLANNKIINLRGVFTADQKKRFKTLNLNGNKIDKKSLNFLKGKVDKKSKNSYT